MSDNNLLITVAVIVLLLLIIIFRIIKSRQEKSSQNEMAAQQRPSPAPAPAPAPEPATPEISVPEKVDGKALAYHYEDVDIIPVIGGVDLVKVGEQLTISDENGSIRLLQRGALVGTMNESKITEMVRDWKRRGDPILAYISKYTADSTSAQAAIFFYRDQMAAFMKKYPDAKKYRLTGKADELAGGYSVGDPCAVEMSIDKDDKYEVLHDGSRIGYLPASAVNYARNNGAEPEDLNVAIAEIDYDIDKDRDIISVLISK